jgi:hypothetical protein
MPIATRLTTAGTLLVNGIFDENTSIAPSKFRTTSNTVFASEFDEFTGAPVVDSSLQLWLDAGQTTSYPGTGTTWTDLSGNGRNGTLTNGPTFSTTNGGSIVFDGTNDYVQCSGSLTVTAATFVAWIRRDGTQTDYDGIFFTRGTNVTGLNIFPTDKLGYHWNQSYYDFDSGLTIPDLTWCMVALSVTSTGATLYLCQPNGITTATNAVSHTSSVLDNIQIAQDDTVALFGISRFFKGNVAAAQLYNRALSLAEIVQNYNALQSRYGLPSITSTQMPVVQRQQSSGTLLVNGEFDEFTGAPVVDTSLQLWLDVGQTTSYPGTGTTWTDLSGKGNNGTLVNSPTYSTSNGGYFSFGSAGSQRTSFTYQTPVQSAATAFTWNIWTYPVANSDAYVLMGYRGTTPLQFYKLTTQKFEMYPAEIFYLFTLNVWQNICVIYDGTQAGTNNMKMYVNGTQVGLRDADAPDLSPSAMPFFVGGDPNASEFATARIAQVMVYNRALTTDEITTNFNALRNRYGI